MKQIQMPNSSAQGSLATATNGLRCTDFNYSNLHKSYYNSEQDKLGSTSSSLRRQIVSMQDRKLSNIYGRYKDYQHLDSKSKKDEINNKSIPKDTFNIEEPNNICQSKEPTQSSLTQSIHQSKYQTPQKGSYHARSYTISLSDQFIQQSDKKLESESPLGDSKQQTNQKYLRYTTDHVRYSTPFKGEISNKSDKQEETQYLSQKISKQEFKKLLDSPTKENEQYNMEDKQQNNAALQSYSGFISRTQNNYYKRQTAFESPVSDEKNLLKESYSKVLNYQTSSAYSKGSHLNSTVKSYRATQSEKKSFQEEIEQYKKELKEYQSQLSSYQEQLKNSLNKNKIELFDSLASIRDGSITSPISQYSKASFLDLKYSTQNSKYQLDFETPKALQKLESNESNIISSRLAQSTTLSKDNSKILKPNMGIFKSIYIEAENIEDKPEKMLQVVNIENSAVLTNDLLEFSNKKQMEGFSEKKLIKIQKVESFYEERELESKNQQKEEYQNLIQENNFLTCSQNGETNNQRCQRYQSVMQREVPEKEMQLQNNINEKAVDYKTRNKTSCSIDHNTLLISSAVFSNNRNYLENASKEDCLSKSNSKDCNQQLPNFQKIDSVSSDTLASSSKSQQSIIKNSNQLISEESSTKQNIMQCSNLQTTKQDSSENIIKTQYDKLKEIENRYKRVEEISKKYSHLYRSKLLQPTQSPISTEQKTTQDLSNSVLANSTDYQNEQNTNSFNNNFENNHQNSFAQQNKEMTTLCLFPNVRDSGVMLNKDQNNLGVALPISNRIQGDESDISFFTQKTPRFQIMEGEEYFKTAEQILLLSRQSANKLDQSLCLTDRETLQNLSQVDIDCDIKHQMQPSPSVTTL